MTDESDAQDGDEPEAVDETPDAADPVSIARQQKKLKYDQANIDLFWQRVLSEPIGRRVLWDLLRSLHTFEERSACTPAGFPAPEMTWYQAGERDVGLRLYRTLLKADFPGLHLMHEEFDILHAKPKPKRRQRSDDAPD